MFMILQAGLLICIAATAYSSPIPKQTKKQIALSYLSACEQKLQLQCIDVFGTKSYFPLDNTCKPEPLISCFKLFMKTIDCKENDPGTIPYVKDFLHRLKRKHIVNGVCLNNFIRTEIQELFQVPDDFQVPAVHPQYFGSGDETTSGPAQSMYYDDTEADDDQSEGSAYGQEEGSG